MTRPPKSGYSSVARPRPQEQAAPDQSARKGSRVFLESLEQRQLLSAATDTTLELTSGSVTGQSATLTATVSSPSGGTPTGNVLFRDGTVILGMAALSPSDEAVLAVNDLAIRLHSFNAIYFGDANFDGSTSPLIISTGQNIPVSTTTVLQGSTASAVAGQSVKLTASVIANGSGAPTGNVTFSVGSTLLGTVALDGSQNAVLNTTSLPIGTDPVIATYQGISGFATSASSAATVTVSRAATTTVVQSSVSSINFGQLETLTAIVTVNPPGSGIANGTAMFFNNGSLIGSAPLDGTGMATFTTSSLPVGSDSITAEYGSSTQFVDSMSSAISVNVAQASSPLATTTTLAPSPSSSVAGQSVTLTATVSAIAAIPTGSVAFMLGSTVLGTQSVDGSGQAALTLSSLAVGPNAITAVYTPTGDFVGSSSSASTVTVSRASTTTAVQSSAPSIDLGQSVTLTAIVTINSPGAGTANGTAIFFANGLEIGTAPLDGAGEATFSTSALPQGSVSVSAEYGSSTQFVDSMSSSIGVTVSQVNNPVATTTTLAPSPASSVFGQGVTLTATVSANAGTPTGSVAFMLGTTDLGAQSVNGSGQAAITLSTLAVGPNAITAVYTPTGNFVASSSSASSVTVSRASTTTVVQSSASTIEVGQSATLTATVTVNSPGAGTANGTAIFFANGSEIGTAPLNGAGIATFTTSALPQGSDSITAEYGSSTQFVDSMSSSIGVNVTQAAPSSTTTALAASLGSTVFGQSETLTATVTAASGTPTGSIAFMLGTTNLGTQSINGSGQAALTLATLPVGSDAITAVYTASGNFANSSSSAATVTVSRAATTTTVSASAASIDNGQSESLTATVTVNSPGSGTANGTALFFANGTLIGTAPLDGTGKAVFTTSGLGLGANSITAAYGSSAQFVDSSSSAISVTVTPGAPTSTTTTLTRSLASSVVGQPVLLNASVAGTGGTPTGSVTFNLGGTVLGTQALDGTGNAALSVSSLPVGSDNITATYAASGSFAGSTSSAVNVTVSRASTTTTVQSSSGSIQSGQSVSLTATVTVSSPGAGTANGSALFFANGNLIATVALDGTGKAVFATTGLPAGSDSITAAYGSSNNFVESTSSAITVNVASVVTSIPTTTKLAPSPTSSVSGQSVTLTATITSGSGTPTGSVAFMLGGTSLGTQAVNGSGQAVLALSSLPVGSDSITAVFTGSGSFTSSSSTSSTVTVARAATTTALQVSAANIKAGQSETLTATVTANSPGSGIPVGTVTFLVKGTVFGTASLDGTGTATLTTTSLPIGTDSIAASYGSSGQMLESTSAAAQVVVGSTAPSTTTTVTSSSLSTILGQQVTFTATVAGANLTEAVPTGTVTFLDGTTTLGTGTLDGNGQATLSMYTLFTGTHSITASYASDGTAPSSTSSAISQKVALGSTTNLGSGLLSDTVVAGSGHSAVTGDTLMVDYTGFLSNGTIFDSSLNPGRTPFEFTLGGNVIAGWNQGLIGAQAGSTIVLVVPPALGYGASGNGSIPGNATLTFVIRVLEFEQPQLIVSDSDNNNPVTPNSAPSALNGTDFGSVVTGQSSSVLTLVLSQGNAAQLEFTANPPVTISGPDAADFAIGQPQADNSGNVFITITFTPGATGTRNAVVDIHTNDANFPDFDINVTGTGS